MSGTAENAEYTEPEAREDSGTQPPLVNEALTGQIRQTAFEVHKYFGRGFLEKVYENALVHRLNKQGLSAIQQKPLAVYDEDGTVVGQYVADIVVNDTVLIEVKAVSSLTNAHRAQALNYLKATGLEVAMLLNFAEPRLQVRRLGLSN